MKALPMVFKEFGAKFATCVLEQSSIQMTRVANVESVVVCANDVNVVHGELMDQTCC